MARCCTATCGGRGAAAIRPVADGRRRASRVTFLVAATFAMHGATSGGAFTASSCTPRAPARPSRRTPSCVLRQAEPRGRPLSEFSVDDVVDGRVAFRKYRSKGSGIFLDIGAEKTALLDAPKRLATKLENNETLKGLRVTKIDVEKGFMDVTYDGLEELIKDRCKQISSFAVGDVVDGRVCAKRGGVGVFVDIGAECDAFLDESFRVAMKLEPNEIMKGLRVTRIDTENCRMTVKFDALEEMIKDRCKPVSSFAEGDVMDGRVVKVLPLKGDILLDVGAEVNAMLQAPPELRQKLRVRDVLKDVRVTKVDLEEKKLAVACDGLEAFVKEREEPEQRK